MASSDVKGTNHQSLRGGAPRFIINMLETNDYNLSVQRYKGATAGRGTVGRCRLTPWNPS
jgi:hypothetical protein